MPDPTNVETKTEAVKNEEAAAAAKVAETKESELTKEQAQENIAGLMSAFKTTKRKPEKVEDKKPEETKTTESTTSEEKTAEGETKTDEKKYDTKPAKVAKPKPRKEVDVADLAETITAAATKAATEAGRSMREEPDKKKQETGERSALLKTFDEMKRLYPDKYGTRDFDQEADQAKQSWKEYQSQWKKDHPGEKFDETSEEHSDHHASLEPDYDDADFVRAERVLENAPIVEKLKKQDEEIAELRRERETERVSKTVQRESSIGANLIAKAVFDAVAPDITGKPVTPEIVKQLSEDFPEATQEVTRAIAGYEAFVTETVRLFDAYSSGRNDYQFDPKNPVHAEIGNFSARLEQNFADADQEQTVLEDGRKFATREAFASMTPAQRAKHWIVGQNEIVRAMAVELANKAKETSVAIENRYKQRVERAMSGKTSAANQYQNGHTKKAETSETTAQTRVAVGAPDGGGRSVSQNPTGTGGSDTRTEAEKFRQNWLTAK